jgi:hypothetical protein
MKIRNGFVSNSSSSSFVVLLPENFLETIDYAKIIQGDDDFPLSDFTRLLLDFTQNGGIWEEEIREYDEEDYEFSDILNDLIRPYVIASMSTSSDGGQIVIANRETVKKLL